MEDKQKISDGYSIHKKREEEIMSIIDERLKKAQEYRDSHNPKAQHYHYFNGKCIALTIIKSDIKKIFSS